MQKIDYSTYFLLPVTPFTKSVFFGVSHFYNRAKAIVGADNYNEILVNRRGGRILLGQLPVDAFNVDLLKELSNSGLIVACVEYYELAGSQTAVKVTPPFIWQDLGIEHHHLPFVDFTDKAEPQLILNTLDKILAAFKDGKSVYVHCKAGRSRSALITALCLCIIELEKENDIQLKPLLQSKIQEMLKQRPSIDIEENKIELGLKVLQQYKERKGLQNQVKNKIHTQSAEFFNKLTQAPAFKALWYFAYNNESFLADMQILMNLLYEDPLLVIACLKSTNNHQNQSLKSACEHIRTDKKGELILTNLLNYLIENQSPDIKAKKTKLGDCYQRFNELLNRYKGDPSLIHTARQLQSDIFLLAVSDEDKIWWLNETSNFLENPDENENYLQLAENLVLSTNLTKCRIGKNMMIIGAIVLSFIFIAAAMSFFSWPGILTFGVPALAVIIIGAYLRATAAEEDVKVHSLELIEECKRCSNH